MKLRDIVRDKVTKAKLAKLGFVLTTKVTPQQVNTLVTLLRGLGLIEAHKWSKKDGRNYDKERKYNDTPKARAYRAKLNKYNRDKGTYANDDGKDASHKGEEIVGFEPSSKNKGRREKSRKKNN